MFDSSSLFVTTVFRRLAISSANGVNCSAASNVVTVTVDSSPIISGTLSSDQPSDTICMGDPGLITFTVNSAVASSTVFYINNSVVQSSTSQTYTASQSIFSDGDIVKTRIVNASGCYSEQNIVISVNEVTAGSISGAQSVCAGTAPITLTSVSSGTINGVVITSPGTGSYQWQDSPDGITWNNILSATSDNYSPPSTLVDKYYRRLTVGILNGLSCSVPTNSFLVTINALPNAGLSANASAITAPATMTSCFGEEVDFIGTGGVEYEFFINGVSVQSRSTSTTYLSSLLFDSDEVLVRAYDSTSASACFADSGIIDFTIDALPMPSLSSSASNDTFCSGDVVTFTAGSGGVAATYEFRVNSTSFQNSTTNIFDPSDYSLTIIDGSEIEVIVSTLSGCSSNVSVILTENGISDFGTISSTTATVCINEIPDPIIGTTASASGTITYRWQNSTDNLSYNDISGATSSTFTPTSPLLVTTFFKRLTQSELNSVICEESTSPFRISVSPVPIPNLNASSGSITAPATLTLCDITASPIFEATGGSSFEFYVDGAIFQTRSAVSTFTATTSSTLLNNSKVYVRVFQDLVGGCFTDSDEISIVIIPQPTISLTSEKFSNTFCTGDDIIITSTSSVAGSNFEFFVNGTSYQDSTSGTFSPTLNSPNAINGGDFITVIVTTPGGCSVTTSITMIENIITPPATPTTTSLTICSGDVPAAIVGTTGSASGTITYQWQNSTDNITFTNISGAISSTYTATTGITTTTYYRRQTNSTLNGIVCSAPSGSVRVDVTVPPIGGITGTATSGGSVTGSSTLTICPGELVTFSATGGASYEYTTSGGTVLQARSTSNTYSSTTLVNNDTVRVTVFDQVAGGCSSETEVITIVDGLAPAITLISDQLADTFCTGDDIIITSTSSVAGSNFEFFVNGTSYQDSTSGTFSPTLNSPNAINGGDFITVIVTTPGGCSVTTSITMIENIITPPATPTTTSLTICSGDVPAAIVGTTGSASGTITYQWQNSTDNITFTNISGAISSTYTATTGITTTTYYRRQTNSTLNGIVCSAPSGSVRVDVTVPPIGGITGTATSGGSVTGSSTLTICPGELVTFSATGGASYEYTTSGGTVLQARSTSNTYSSTTLVNNDTVRVTVFDQVAGGCSSETEVITIVDGLAPAITLISDQLADTFCTGDDIIITSTSSVAGSNFEFFVNGTSYQDSTSGTFSPTLNSPNAINGGDFITVIVTTPGGCSVTTSITMIENIITPPATPTTTSLTICSGDVPAAIVGTTGSASGTITYQWQNSTDNITFTNISGAISSTYTATTGITTTTYYRRQTNSTLNGIVCSAPSGSVRVDVTVPPIGGITGTATSGGSVTGSSTLTICPGELVTFSATGGASYEYTTSGGTVLQARSTSNTYSSTTLVNNDTVRVTVFDQVAGGCSSETEVITIVDGLAPAITLISDQLADTFCTGDDIIITSTSSVAGSNFEFFVNGTSYQDSTSGTFSPTLNSPNAINGGDFITVIVTTPGGCSVTTSITMIENIITPPATPTTTSLTICSGDVPAAIVGTTGSASGTITYQWQNSTDNITFTNISGAISSTYTATTGITTTTYYRRQTNSTLNGIVCSAPSGSVRVDVTVPPIGGITGTATSGGSVTGSSTLTICPGELVTFSATGGASYEYTTSGGTVLQARSTSNTYSSTTLVNNDTVRVTVFDQVAGGCSSETEVITIVDGLAPAITLISDQLADTFCTGDDIIITSTSSVAGSNFEFFVNGTSYQDSTSGTFSPTLNSPNAINGGDFITVIVTTPGGCSVTTSITMIENIITPPATPTTTSLTICSGDVPAAIVGTTGSASGTITYQWQNSTDNITFTNISGAISSTYTATTGITTTTYYRRQTNSTLNGIVCSAPSGSVRVDVTVPPIGGITGTATSGGSVTGSSTLTICPGELVTFSATGGASYEYTTSGGTVLQARSTSNTYSSTTLVNNDTVRVTVFDQVAGGCSSETEVITIVDGLAPAITLISDQLADTFCTGDDIIITSTSSVAGSTFTFYVEGVLQFGH